MNSLKFEKIINLAANETEKGARVVAKAFYRILRKKGFSENQIINISTNILNCLVESLRGYEKKIEFENAKESKKYVTKEDADLKGIDRTIVIRPAIKHDNYTELR